MKRRHRRWHALAWLVLAPATMAVLASAWLSRATVPSNPEIPAQLGAVATPKGG